MLLCSHNPILTKSLYGILIDEGYSVKTTDHPANAVQMVIDEKYFGVIIDPEPFGLGAEDAVRIIKSVSPATVVIFVGFDRLETDTLNLRAPVDLEEFKQAIRDIHFLNNH